MHICCRIREWAKNKDGTHLFWINLTIFFKKVHILLLNCQREQYSFCTRIRMSIRLISPYHYISQKRKMNYSPSSSIQNAHNQSGISIEFVWSKTSENSSAERMGIVALVQRSRRMLSEVAPPSYVLSKSSQIRCKVGWQT